MRYEGSLSAIGRLRQSVPRVVSAGRRCTRPRRALRERSGETYGAAIMQRGDVWRCDYAAGERYGAAGVQRGYPMRAPWCTHRAHYSAHGAGEEDMTWHGLRPRRRRRHR